MTLLNWAIATLLLVAVAILAYSLRRARRRDAIVRKELSRLEAEQNRMLQGLILSQEAASRILTPGELSGTIERIAREAVDVLGVEGVCILVRPPEGTDEPIGICWGHIPEGMNDVGRPIGPDPVADFGSVLTIPIRLGDRWLGEFRIAESAGRALNLREVHVARLLAQLVAISAQYRIQKRTLEQTEEDKRRFIVATTHDLRAPLATIEQLTIVMRDGYAGEMTAKQRELMEKIAHQTTHLLELLADLLDLAAENQAIGSARHLVPVSLSAVFDAQLVGTRAACEAKGISFIAERPDTPLMRTAAEGDMEKILGNLLSNAVKYTPPGGRIEARIEESPGGVMIRVRDTGIGIPKEAMSRLFTEYFRASNAKLLEKHGTGLGLALVQRLVRKYGGRIRVDSILEQGTVFEVLLPPE